MCPYAYVPKSTATNSTSKLANWRGRNQRIAMGAQSTAATATRTSENNGLRNHSGCDKYGVATVPVEQRQWRDKQRDKAHIARCAGDMKPGGIGVRLRVT